LDIPCPWCGAYLEAEGVFCVRCERRAIPLTAYDITVDDFIYPADRDALESLRQFGLLTSMVNSLIVRRYVDGMGHWLSRSAVEVDLRSELGAIIRECGVMLGLKSLPRTYILRGGSANAFTFGYGDIHYLVLTSRLLDELDWEEVKAVVSHELGHVKCEHMAYHTLAELLTDGLELSSKILGAGLDLLSPMFKLMLLSWHRESEVSADRASLLVVGDIDVVKSVLGKLCRRPPETSGAGLGGPSDPLLEILSTHPTYRNRVKLLEEYYGSGEYAAAREKLIRRIQLSRALVPRCRYCGASKRITDLFCPECGRSQL